MVRTAEETGRKLAVNNVLRFYPRFERVKELVETALRVEETPEGGARVVEG